MRLDSNFLSTFFEPNPNKDVQRKPTERERERTQMQQQQQRLVQDPGQQASPSRQESALSPLPVLKPSVQMETNSGAAQTPSTSGTTEGSLRSPTPTAESPKTGFGWKSPSSPSQSQGSPSVEVRAGRSARLWTRARKVSLLDAEAANRSAGATFAMGVFTDARADRTQEDRPGEGEEGFEDVLLKLVRDVPFFANMNEDKIRECVPLMQIRQLVKEEVLYVKGEDAMHAFLVLSGRLSIRVEGQEMGHVWPGQCVGDCAALSRTSRHATMKAMAATELVQIESDCFQKLLDMGGCARTLDPEVSWRVKEIVETPPVDRSSEDVRQLAQAMQRLPLFEALSPLHQLYCAKVARYIAAEKQTVLCREGQVGNLFFCVLSGCVTEHFGTNKAASIKQAKGQTLEDFITSAARRDAQRVLESSLPGESQEDVDGEEGGSVLREGSTPVSRAKSLRSNTKRQISQATEEQDQAEARVATFTPDDGPDADADVSTMTVVLPGMTFGAASLLGRELWRSSLLVEQPTELLVVDGESFQTTCRLFGKPESARRCLAELLSTQKHLRSPEHHQEVRRRCCFLPWLANLPDDVRDPLCRSLQYTLLAPGETAFRAGELASAAFVVLGGEMTELKLGAASAAGGDPLEIAVRRHSSWQTCGEGALDSNPKAPDTHPLTARATRLTDCIVVDAELYRRLMSQHKASQMERRASFLANAPVLKGLPLHVRQRIAHVAASQTVHRGQMLAPTSTGLTLIESGELVAVWDPASVSTNSRKSYPRHSNQSQLGRAGGAASKAPLSTTAAECTPLSLSRLIRLACLSAGDLVGGGDVGATRESYLATAPVRLLTVTHAQLASDDKLKRHLPTILKLVRIKGSWRQFRLHEVLQQMGVGDEQHFRAHTYAALDFGTKVDHMLQGTARCGQLLPENARPRETTRVAKSMFARLARPETAVRLHPPPPVVLPGSQPASGPGSYIAPIVTTESHSPYFEHIFLNLRPASPGHAPSVLRRPAGAREAESRDRSSCRAGAGPRASAEASGAGGWGREGVRQHGATSPHSTRPSSQATNAVDRSVDGPGTQTQASPDIQPEQRYITLTTPELYHPQSGRRCQSTLPSPVDSSSIPSARTSASPTLTQRSRYTTKRQHPKSASRWSWSEGAMQGAFGTAGAPLHSHPHSPHTQSPTPLPPPNRQTARYVGTRTEPVTLASRTDQKLFFNREASRLLKGTAVRRMELERPPSPSKGLGAGIRTDGAVEDSFAKQFMQRARFGQVPEELEEYRYNKLDGNDALAPEESFGSVNSRHSNRSNSPMNRRSEDDEPWTPLSQQLAHMPLDREPSEELVESIVENPLTQSSPASLMSNLNSKRHNHPIYPDPTSRVSYMAANDPNFRIKSADLDHQHTFISTYASENHTKSGVSLEIQGYNVTPKSRVVASMPRGVPPYVGEKPPMPTSKQRILNQLNQLSKPPDDECQLVTEEKV